MQIERQVKFLVPQNFSGASQKNRVASFSRTIEVEEDMF